ncbi:MAG: elongation factor G, partial [Lentisphaeria bacterium]|nr:elongation factor G [Lentisphaeria bacterium]
GDNGQYAHLILQVAPRDGEHGLGIEFAVLPGEVPECYRPAIAEAIRAAADSGIAFGHPLTGLQVTVAGGSFRAGESSESAFRAVAGLALKEAVRAARPVLLEPIVAVEVRTPQECLGDVIADLAARRGRVAEVDAAQAQCVRVVGQAPLAELCGYATELRSLTKGRADFATEPLRFERVSPDHSHQLLHQA